MYLGRHTYTINELLERIADPLVEDAKDMILHDAPRHSVLKDLHVFQVRGQKATIVFNNDRIKSWSCTCAAFAKKNSCAHVTLGVIILKNTEKNTKKNSVNKLLSSYQALNLLDPPELSRIMLRIIQKDKSLDQLIKILALFKEEENFSNAELKKSLETQLLSGSWPKSRTGLLKILKNTQIWYELSNELSAHISGTRRWIFLYFLLRTAWTLDLKIQTKATLSLLQDLHMEALHFLSLDLAPELRSQIISDLRGLALFPSYRYLGQHSAFELLSRFDEIGDIVFDRLHSILMDAKMPFQNWERLISWLCLSPQPSKTIQLLALPSFPLQSLIKQSLEVGNQEVVIHIVEMTRGFDDADHPVIRTLLRQVPEITKDRVLSQALFTSSWMQSLLNDIEQRKKMDYLPAIQGQKLLYSYWRHTENQEQISNLLASSDNIDHLIALEEIDWMNQNVQQMARELLRRYLSSHHGQIPRNKIKTLLRTQGLLAVPEVYNDMEQIAHSMLEEALLVNSER